MKNITPLAELLDSLRNIEGFPLGKDEDILKLSDPPFYTACPNPYINDFIKEHGKPYDEATDTYHREPYVGDVSEGKNDPIYNAHSYHTKVPHKAIMKYIEHYTDEGDIVLDGFCGTGMTGVAAQMLKRKAILSDLSPIATFIAYNYNKSVDVMQFEKEAKRILAEVEEECGWMYETYHEVDLKNFYFPKGEKPEDAEFVKIDDKYYLKAKINYTVWSDVFICPYCGNEIVFWDVAVDKDMGEVLDTFPCPHCRAEMKKTDCQRATHTFFDKAIDQQITQAKQVPVMINYTCSYNGKNIREEKTPDKFDLQLIEKIEEMDIPYWFPTNQLPDGYNTQQPIRSHGITHVHHFYTKRNLWVLGALGKDLTGRLKFFFTALLINNSKMGRYGKRTGNVSGTLYIPSLVKDLNVIEYAHRKLNGAKGFIQPLTDLSTLDNMFLSSLQSTNNLSNIVGNAVDYVFTDPPFGDNLMYSELNYLWESWLKVHTNNKSEAIINSTQNKGLPEYYDLMLKAFKEYYRVLKPNRWITVEFHNSKSSVWNAIQEGISKAGFIIANVSVLDKKQGSFKQVTSTGAVKNDLVISAYKPKQEFEQNFLKKVGVGFEADFVRMHLEHQPCEPTIERTEQMLYSKMLAYYVQRGYEIRMDSKEFYRMLRENFVAEDQYWFNMGQLESYRDFKRRMRLDSINLQDEIFAKTFVMDEKSAIAWLYSFLAEPKDFSSIHTAFTKVLQKITEEKMPELREILEANFVFENGLYRIPQTEDEKLSLTDRRERALMREFEAILLEARGSRRKLKEVRKESLYHGFSICYRSARFGDIITIARKLDSSILENNPELKDFVEIAEIKLEGL